MRRQGKGRLQLPRRFLFMMRRPRKSLRKWTRRHEMSEKSWGGILKAARGPEVHGGRRRLRRGQRSGDIDREEGAVHEPGRGRDPCQGARADRCHGAGRCQEGPEAELDQRNRREAVQENAQREQCEDVATRTTGGGAPSREALIFVRRAASRAQ